MLLKIILLIDVLAVISITFIEQKKPVETLLWIIIIILFPFGGLILYLVFGSTLKIKIMYMRKKKRLREEISNNLYASSQIPKKQALEDNSIIYTNQQLENINFNKLYNSCPLAMRNEVKIITNAKEKYKMLFSDINHAQHSVNMVYYAIHNDSIGQQLVSMLVEAAKRGVKVRIMYDRIGSLAVTSNMFKPLIDAGGQVYGIKTHLTHFRNHRKIVVIDGTIGYTGGMNIGEKYTGVTKKSPWRDTQMRIKGDAVYYLQYQFYYDWCYANPKYALYDMDIRKTFPEHEVIANLPCQIIAGGVDTIEESMKMAYIRLINSAKRKIIIQTPYFVPDDNFISAIKIAAASGVEVILILPSCKPSFFLEPATNYYIAWLLPYGIKVFKYNGYIHSKTITIDDSMTCIGTANIDIRSLELDDEIIVVFYDEEFTKKHLNIINEDLKHSKQLDVQSFQNRSVFKRIEERFFQLFSPLL